MSSANFPYLLAVSPFKLSKTNINRVTIGTEMNFILGHHINGMGICSKSARSAASEVLRERLISSSKIQLPKASENNSSLLFRLIVVGRQYGTDKNDGDPSTAFYHVIKMANINFEQISSHKSANDIIFYWFKWTPPGILF
jgi:hypothetical protein